MADPRNDKPFDRRGFFREGLASILGPLADIFEKRLERVRKSFDMMQPSETRLLRPPGALPEADFLRTCQSCGKCVSVCPVGAIYMTRDPAMITLDGQRVTDATPVINPVTQPCVVCDSLVCMAACPSGALVRSPADRIHMGTAAWGPEHCLRTTGEDCRRCVDQCPRGEQAIRLDEPEDMSKRPPVVVEPNGCVGCGVCEHYCPSSPKAIVVYPNR